MKKLPLIVRILSSLVLPIVTGVAIYFLSLFLPDSRHIITISSFGNFFAILSTVLFLFDENKLLRYLARSALFISIVFWITLFFNVFYIYHVSILLSVILAILYLGIAVTLCIFIGKQKIFVYGWVIVAILLGGFFDYLSIMALLYSHRIYSILLCAGATGILASIFYYMIDTKKYHFRHAKVVRCVLIIISQALITASTVLMIL